MARRDYLYARLAARSPDVVLCARSGCGAWLGRRIQDDVPYVELAEGFIKGQMGERFMERVVRVLEEGKQGPFDLDDWPMDEAPHCEMTHHAAERLRRGKLPAVRRRDTFVAKGEERHHSVQPQHYPVIVVCPKCNTPQVLDWYRL